MIVVAAPPVGDLLLTSCVRTPDISSTPSMWSSCSSLAVEDFGSWKVPAAFDLTAEAEIGLPIVGWSGPLRADTSRGADVGDWVTAVKAFAFWSIVDPAIDGAFCLAPSLFDSVFAAPFLPLALPSTCG